MLAAIALGLLLTKRRPRSLVLRDEIITSSNKRDITILIDTGGEEIFISQSFIKDTQIPKPKQLSTIVRAINNYQIPSYKTYNLVFNLVDSRGKK